MPGIRRHLLRSLGAALLFAPAAGAALAETPIETELKAFVAGIDASPDWAAKYGGLTYDPATDTVTLSGLTIGAERGGLQTEINTVTVAGYLPAAGGGFALKSLAIGGMTVDAGLLKVAIDDVEFDDLVVPSWPAFSYDRERPFTSLMRAYSGVLGVKLASGRIGSLAMIQQMAGITSRVAYEHFRIDGIADGKIASVRAGPLRLETPSPEGLVTMIVGSVESRDVDLGAFVRVYSPDYYVNGVGDMVWHTALGLAAYRDVEMGLPGMKITMREFAVEDFKLRQPKNSFGEFMDAAMANMSKPMPKEQLAALAARTVPSLFSAMGVGRFGLEGLQVEAEGIDRFVLDDFHVSDFSGDGLGEIALEGLEAAVAGQGAIKIGRIALGGLQFPPLETLLAATVGAGPGVPGFNPAMLIPKLGFAEALDLDVATPQVPRTRLGKARIDLGNYIGPVPTSVAAEVSGFDVPLALMDREGRATFKRLGYERIVANYRLKYSWDEASGTLSLDDLHFSIKDMGGVTVSAQVAGVTREALEQIDDPSGLAGLSLVNARLTFTDESIVGKSLGLLAERMKVPPEKFRQQFADALPFLLSISALNDPAVMAILKESGLFAKLTPAIKTFVAAPGSLIVSLAPAAPVGIGAIMQAASEAPGTLPALLNLTLTAEPSANPAPLVEPAPAPGVEAPLRPTTPPQ